MPFLYDYYCEDHGLFEDFSSMDHRDFPKPCPECGASSGRIQSAIRFKLEGITGHFPTAADKWATLHEREGRKEPN